MQSTYTTSTDQKQFTLYVHAARTQIAVTRGSFQIDMLLSDHIVLTYGCSSQQIHMRLTRCSRLVHTRLTRNSRLVHTRLTCSSHAAHTRLTHGSLHSHAAHTRFSLHSHTAHALLLTSFTRGSLTLISSPAAHTRLSPHSHAAHTRLTCRCTFHGFFLINREHASFPIGGRTLQRVKQNNT